MLALAEALTTASSPSGSWEPPCVCGRRSRLTGAGPLHVPNIQPGRTRAPNVFVYAAFQRRITPRRYPACCGDRKRSVLPLVSARQSVVASLNVGAGSKATATSPRLRIRHEIEKAGFAILVRIPQPRSSCGRHSPSSLGTYTRCGRWNRRSSFPGGGVRILHFGHSGTIGTRELPSRCKAPTARHRRSR